MQKYKITAGKEQKKYNFVVSAYSENEAKERVHKSWYTILNVEIFNENNASKKTFIFEAKKNWEAKQWKVIWDDIFKVYFKLRNWVWLDVLKLFQEEDRKQTDEYKENLLKDLEEQYDYFKETHNLKEEKNDSQKEEEKHEINIDSFYMKKELEDTYKLIDSVLEKLNFIIWNSKYNIDDETGEKLEILKINIIKIKASTNLIKLKEVGIKALYKVWQIELELLEKNKDIKSKNYLSETNKLLKQMWSWKSFIEEDKDIKKQFEKFILKIKDFFELFKKDEKEKKELEEKKEKELDISSHSYLKNVMYLNKYKQKLKESNKEILKNFYLFILPFGVSKDKKNNILLKRGVILQNIALFKAKKEGTVFSYTRVLQSSFGVLGKSIFNNIKDTKDYLFWMILLYCLLFIIFFNLNLYNIIPWLGINFNYIGILYFLIFLLIYFAINLSKNIIILTINFFIVFVMSSFLVIFI